MMTGKVAHHQANLVIGVYDSMGNEISVRAVIDMGFTGQLTLDPGIINSLNLPLVGSRQAVLGDGTPVDLPLYRGMISWQGVPRQVLILAAEGEALIGMGLLHGSELTLPVLDGATFTIRPVPPGDAPTA
jgi:clan AA aspartic protease